MLDDLRAEYEQRVERERTSLLDLHLESKQLQAEELQWARRHLLLVEKGQVIDAFRTGSLSQRIQERLLADIDAEVLRLESEQFEEPDRKKT